MLESVPTTWSSHAGSPIVIEQRGSVGDLKTCLDCGGVLTPLQRVRQETFCGAHCRARHGLLPAHESCVSCGRRLKPYQFGERLCGVLACRRRLEERNREQERLRIESIRREALRLRDRGAQSLAVLEPELYPVVVVPSLRRRLVPLEEGRLLAFRDRLARVIAEALARRSQTPKPVESPTVEPPSPTLALLDQACALCQGSCCRNGGNHAYVTRETVQKVLTAHPEQSHEGLLAIYLCHLREESVEGSCIYHQGNGCGLPRELRSETCNRFLCEELGEYRDTTIARGFVASTADSRIIEAAFCGEEGVRRVIIPKDPTRDSDSANSFAQ